MLKVAIKNLLGRKLRLVLTSIAVVLGVAFMAGTFVLTDTMGHVFDKLFVDATKGVDAVVRAKEPFKAQGQQAASTRPPVPEGLAARVGNVNGVDLAHGNVFEYALVHKHVKDDKQVEGASGTNQCKGDAIENQAPTFGTGWYYPATTAVNQSLSLVRYRGALGHQPRTDHEVALDLKTANDGHFALNDPVCMTFQTGAPQRFTLTGVFLFGGKEDGLAGATLAAFKPKTAQQLMDRVGTWDQIDVRAKPGMSQGAIRDALRAQLPQFRRALAAPPLEAITGDQLAKEQANNIKDQLSFFNTFLLVFAIVALFVGAFVIYNTFSITVAQRTRELGLMRALGASGRQVVGSVALEALVVGLLSSLLGLAAGILIVKPLEGLFSLFGVDLPSGTTQILPRTIIVSLVVGTVVTFVSALAPARRAARVPPIAALRDQAIPPSSGRRRYIWGTVLSIIGAAALGLGLTSSGSSAPIIVGVAAALVFIGVAMLSPLIAPYAARVLTWPAVRLKSITGSLARRNAMRNPRRTASTAAALMIGLALISVISIVAESAKNTFTTAIEDQTTADFVLSPKNFAPFSSGAATEIRQQFTKQLGSPGTIVEWRSGTVEIAGSPNEVLGVTPNFRRTSAVPLRGRLDIGALRAGGVAISDSVAGDRNCVTGATDLSGPKVTCHPGVFLPIRFPTATKAEAVPVAGVYTDAKALGSNTDYVLGFDPTTQQWEQRFASSLDNIVLIRKPVGAPTQVVSRIVHGASDRIGGIDAKNKEKFVERQVAQFNQIIGLVYVLLAFAVLIALIGIANTLALSIFERTREIGLLRAVGMSRRQLRRMIRGEAVVVAVFGSLLGLGIGVLFGIAIVAALSSEGIDLSVPIGQLVVFVVIAGLFGLLAGTWPARRAARLDVLRAVNAE